MGDTGVYARVSTDRQSHKRQTQECLEFIENDVVAGMIEHVDEEALL
jgi:DNA invertase Pin-like site-specific DNA recombinase